jgi:hypothetical protein
MAEIIEKVAGCHFGLPFRLAQMRQDRHALGHLVLDADDLGIEIVRKPSPCHGSRVN